MKKKKILIITTIIVIVLLGITLFIFLSLLYNYYIFLFS